MNETTKVIRNLLIDHNPDEMAIMFKSADGMEEFADAINSYVATVVMAEIDYGAIAEFFAEMPYR